MAFTPDAFAQLLVEESPVGAGNDDGRCRVEGTDDESLLFGVVANQTGDDVVTVRSGESVGVAKTLLVRRRILLKLRSAVGKRVRHASLG